MKWFKFYGSEYLSDPKMLALSPAERSCLITLLCYASVNDNEEDNNVVRYLTEDRLMSQAGLDPKREEWEETVGVLKKFVSLDIIELSNDKITLLNWKKRQETNLTGYERVKRCRDKKRNANVKITSEEKRVDKNRIEENKKETASISYLSKIPQKDIEEFLDRFETTEAKIRSKAEDLKLYCKSKGKPYKDYKSFLLNALKKDFKEKKSVELPHIKVKNKWVRLFVANKDQYHFQADDGKTYTVEKTDPRVESKHVKNNNP